MLSHWSLKALTLWVTLVGGLSTWAQGAPQPDQIAIWQQTDAEDSGRIEWVSAQTCRTKFLKASPFQVSDFTSEHMISDFEALRSDGKFDKSGANITAYLPKGSLVTAVGKSTRDYERVMVVSSSQDSRAPYGVIARPLAQGYIFKESLSQLNAYILTLTPSAETGRAKAQGVDLENAGLSSINDKNGRYKILECCTRKNCERFQLFAVNRDQTAAPEVTIGISAKSPSLLKTATGLLDEESGDADEPTDAELVSPQARSTGGGLPIGLTPVLPAPAAEAVGAGAVICGEEPATVVFGPDLTTVLYSVGGKDAAVAVKIVQSFEGAKKTKVVGGKTIFYINVHSEGRADGWVAEGLVKDRLLCKNNGLPGLSPHPVSQSKPPLLPAIEQSDLNTGNYIFPLLHRPSASYVQGQASGAKYFGALRRGGKRIHAACDLLRPQGEAVRALGTGRIIRAAYKFYGKNCRKCSKAYAIEQQLTDGRIIRYGEVGSKGNAGVGKVARDQKIGVVSFTRMLHLEMYSGKGDPEQSLTIRPSCPKRKKCKATFERRSDLMNPTNDLRAWEKATFGAGY